MRAHWLLPLIPLLLLAHAIAGRDVRVAVVPVGDDAANLAAILEEQLGHQKGVSLVERAQVDAILREQQVQALFSPESVGRRAEFGKLLGADMLIMLRKSPPPCKGYELIACETSQGLRLCVEHLPAGDDGTVDSAKLKVIAAAALKKRDEDVLQIVAVPPLVSNDLAFTAQALQRPFARLIEQTLLHRSGLLVVEMAEAKAIAKEMAVSNGASVARASPLYLLGDYRHDNTSGQGPMKFQIRLVRDGKQLSAKESPSLKSEEVAMALPKRALEMIDAAAAAGKAQTIIGDEAAQLAERAQTMFRVESWSEAVDLAEASLLLKPNRIDMHRVAAYALMLEAQPINDSQQREALYAQGLPHLEIYLASANVSRTSELALVSPYLLHCSDHAALRALFLRVMAVKQAAAVTDETLDFTHSVLVSCCGDLNAEETNAWKFAAAARWPEAADRDGQRLARFMAWKVSLSDREKVQLLAQGLREVDTPVARQASRVLANLPKAIQAQAADQFVENAHPRDNATALRAVEAANIKATPLPGNVTGAVAVNDTLDIAWGNNLFYLWPGAKSAEPQPFLHIIATAGSTPVDFDGRYAWAYCTGLDANKSKTNNAEAGKTETNRPATGIAIIDPVNKRFALVGTSKGLPADPVRSVSIAALEPGKACVVGHIGPAVGGRVWIALVALDKARPDLARLDSADASVNVFHEAGDFPREEAIDWKNTHLAFNTSRAHTLRFRAASGQNQLRVLVERGELGHPLLIDPQNRQVTAIAEPVHGESSSQLVDHDGAVYWIGPSGDGYAAYRYALPTLKIECGTQQFDEPGTLFFCRQGVGLFTRSGKLFMASSALGSFHNVPLANPGRLDVGATTQFLASEKHGLLMSTLGSVYEWTLPAGILNSR